MLSNLIRGETEGQGLLEYGLILSFVSLAAVIALIAVGGSVTAFFETVPDMFDP